MRAPGAVRSRGADSARDPGRGKLAAAANVATLQHPVETLTTAGKRQFIGVSLRRTFSDNRAFREAAIFKDFFASATRRKMLPTRRHCTGSFIFEWQIAGHRSAMFSPQAPAYWTSPACIRATWRVAAEFGHYILETGKHSKRITDCGKVTNRTSGRFRSVRGLHSLSYCAGTGPHPKRRLFPQTSG